MTDADFAERAVVFGRSRHLVGVLSMPPAPAAPPPCVVFINSGIIHRVGSNRMYVRLARALARHGAATLRFDLSGIGDSSQPADQLEASRAEIAQRDIDDALALMEREGAGPLIVAGLCSGADNALAAIVRNERVAGAVLLDGFAFRTPRYFVKYFGPRLLRPSSWWGTLTGRSTTLKNLVRSAVPTVRGSPSAPAPDAGFAETTTPSQAEYQGHLEALLARGARLLYVFTGGLPERYIYREQLFDAFASLNLPAKVGFAYMPDAGHTFDREVDQSALETRVVTWFEAHFPTEVGARV